MAPSIVFDFDGTLAIGHGPVRAYARLIAPAAGSGFAERVERALTAFEAGETEFRDGYDVVGTLAREAGVDPADLQAAYTESRAQLGTELAPVDTMPQLDAFLETLGRSARLLLATNAPEHGIDRVLAAWGVRDRFSALHFAIGKPEGLTRLVTALTPLGPVLTVGDIAEFDLTPAGALGADTALVGATAAFSPASVTLRGPSLAALRTDIETWAATAASSTHEPIGSAPGIER